MKTPSPAYIDIKKASELTTRSLAWPYYCLLGSVLIGIIVFPWIHPALARLNLPFYVQACLVLGGLAIEFHLIRLTRILTMTVVDAESGNPIAYLDRILLITVLPYLAVIAGATLYTNQMILMFAGLICAGLSFWSYLLLSCFLALWTRHKFGSELDIEPEDDSQTRDLFIAGRWLFASAALLVVIIGAGVAIHPEVSCVIFMLYALYFAWCTKVVNSLIDGLFDYVRKKPDFKTHLEKTRQHSEKITEIFHDLVSGLLPARFSDIEMQLAPIKAYVGKDDEVTSLWGDRLGAVDPLNHAIYIDSANNHALFVTCHEIGHLAHRKTQLTRIFVALVLFPVVPLLLSLYLPVSMLNVAFMLSCQSTALAFAYNTHVRMRTSEKEADLFPMVAAQKLVQHRLVLMEQYMNFFNPLSWHIWPLELFRYRNYAHQQKMNGWIDGIQTAYPMLKPKQIDTVLEALIAEYQGKNIGREASRPVLMFYSSAKEDVDYFLNEYANDLVYFPLDRVSQKISQQSRYLPELISPLINHGSLDELLRDQKSILLCRNALLDQKINALSRKAGAAPVVMALQGSVSLSAAEDFPEKLLDKTSGIINDDEAMPYCDQFARILEDCTTETKTLEARRTIVASNWRRIAATSAFKELIKQHDIKLPLIPLGLFIQWLVYKVVNDNYEKAA